MPQLGQGVLGRHLLSLAQRLGPGDFHSLRDYVEGDEPRSIHWRASARSEELKVRQDTVEGLRRCVVLLDQHVPSGDAGAEAFERAVTVAASIVHSADRAGLDDTLRDDRRRRHPRSGRGRRRRCTTWRGSSLAPMSATTRRSRSSAIRARGSASSSPSRRNRSRGSPRCWNGSVSHRSRPSTCTRSPCPPARRSSPSTPAPRHRSSPPGTRSPARPASRRAASSPGWRDERAQRARA